MGRKIDLIDYQKYISILIAVGRGLKKVGEQEFGGSEAPQEDLKILQNRRSKIEDRRSSGSDTPWTVGLANF